MKSIEIVAGSVVRTHEVIQLVLAEIADRAAEQENLARFLLSKIEEGPHYPEGTRRTSRQWL